MIALVGYSAWILGWVGLPGWVHGMGSWDGFMGWILGFDTWLLNCGCCATRLLGSRRLSYRAGNSQS
nr:hypothetical protein Q903MT_gene2912 [Picea sitchensis]